MAADQRVVTAIAVEVVVEDVAEQDVRAGAAPDVVAAAAAVNDVLARTGVNRVAALTAVELVIAIASTDQVLATNPVDLVRSRRPEDDVTAVRADEVTLGVLLDAFARARMLESLHGSPPAAMISTDSSIGSISPTSHAKTSAPEAAAKAHGLTHMKRFVVGSSGLEPELEAAAPVLAKDQFSAPVKTKVGWTVVRALGTAKGTPLDDKALRVRVREALERRKATAAENEKLAQLRAAAKIERLLAP